MGVLVIAEPVVVQCFYCCLGDSKDVWHLKFIYHISPNVLIGNRCRKRMKGIWKTHVHLQTSIMLEVMVVMASSEPCRSWWELL